MILIHWFEQSNENVLTIGGSEDGLSSVTRSGAAADWKQSGIRRVVSKDVNATTVTVYNIMLLVVTLVQIKGTIVTN